MAEMTPGELAAYEQEMASCNQALSILLSLYSKQKAQAGEVQAVSFLMDQLAECADADDLTGMLVAAVIKLSAESLT
jgi:hypothetical protein